MDTGWEILLNLATRISPWGLVAAFVIAMITGRLVPRSTMQDVRQDRDHRIAEIAAERDDWKTAHFTDIETLKLLGGQVTDLMEVAQTSEAILRTLKQGPL